MARNRPQRAVPEVGSSKPTSEVELPTYFAILNGVQEQVRFADTKAAFLSALNALLFAFLSDGTCRLRDASSVSSSAFAATCVLMTVYVVCAAISVVFIVWSVMSRFGELAPKSKVYFGHIITQYGKDYGKYATDMKSMTDEEWANEIGTQIVEVSHIALTKHRLLRTAAKFTVAAFLFWVLVLFALAFITGA